MAEQNSIITMPRRIALAKLMAGTISTIPPVAHIALGDGGVNSSGQPVAPRVDQLTLTHEVCRYPIASATFPDSTTASFTATVPEDEQASVKFSEMALIDSEGNAAAIKTMFVKQKDDDVKFLFVFDVEF